MPHATVRFATTEIRSLGRNGNFLTTGLSISTCGSEIFLEPITSRGQIANCRIVLPTSKAGELADLLIPGARFCEITFPETEFKSVGRNRYVQTHGIVFSKAGDEHFLQPITSRGETSSCRIVLPATALSEIAKALRAVASAPSLALAA